MSDYKDILSKMDTLLGARSDDLYGTKPVFEEEMFDRMFSFITSLDPEMLSEEQANEIMDMIEDIELEYEDIDEDTYLNEDDMDDMDEAAPKRVRRDRAAQRKRRKAYKSNKAARKRAAKRYRKSSRGRMMSKKSKRMAKRGKTATGRRKRTYVN